MTTETPENGLHTTYHDEGQKKWVGNYKDGKQDGKWIKLHKNGQKSSEGNYIDGECVSGDC